MEAVVAAIEHALLFLYFFIHLLYPFLDLFMFVAGGYCGCTPRDGYRWYLVVWILKRDEYIQLQIN